MKNTDTNYGTEHARSSAPLPYQSSPPPGAETILELCSQCGAQHHESSNFCMVCGTPMNRLPPPLPPTNTPQHAAARGLAQIFCLHPALAFFIILVDAMVSAVDVASLGISAPVLWLIASIFTGVAVFMGQKKWGGDDQESAFIKALIVGFLVALPTPFPSFLTVPSGVVGMVQILRKKVN